MPASTVTEYLAALPADRRDALNEVRRGINRALPPGYKEGIQFRMNSQTAALTNWSYFAKCGHDYFSHVAFQSADALRTCRAVSLICALSRFRVYPDVAVAPAKALMVNLPHASIHRD